MPRIYRCWHVSDPSRFYIGSTSQTLPVRLSKHMNNAKREMQDKRCWFKYIRKKRYSGFRIELLAEADKQHLLQMEEKYIRQLHPEFNTNHPN